MNARRPNPQRPTPNHRSHHYNYDWYWRYPYWDYPYDYYDDFYNDYYNDYYDYDYSYLDRDSQTGNGPLPSGGMNHSMAQSAYQKGFAHGVKFHQQAMAKNPPVPPTPPGEGE